MKNYAIVWSDFDGDGRVRLLSGTEADLTRAIAILTELYADEFEDYRVLEDVVFAPIGALEDELVEAKQD